LATFARENPSVQITVSPRPNKHPMLRAHYVNGRERTICARKMTTHEVHEKALILRNASGDKVKKIKDKVISQNESVRGVWDAYHGAQFKI
jgi:large subunit ribosomal protein L43